MQRRQTNSTRYDPRSRKLFWRLEWRFSAAAPAAADATAAPPPAAAGPNKAGASAEPSQPASANPQQPQQQQAAAAAAVVYDGKVDEETLLSGVLGRHLEYRQGAGAQALQLRAYREAGLEGLTVLMRKERCPVSLCAEQSCGLCNHV